MQVISDDKMSAPYWGNLEHPVPSRQNSTRRQSHGDEQYPSQIPQPTRANRISMQSHAPTVSTMSPLESPTASTFRADGLAPRPPSFTYGGRDDRDREFTEKRRRRASREEAEEYSKNDAGAPLPPAPDVPRAPPPVTYRQPYRNGGSFQNQTSIKSSQRNIDPDDPADYYRKKPLQRIDTGGNTNIRQRNINSDHGGERRASGGQVYAAEDSIQSAGIRRGSVDARKRPEYHDPGAQSHSRKGSAAEMEAQRRREWAPDRSPLQRLELTLDSITKEEKRARVEEAELVAREAKAGRGGDRAIQNSVRFRNRGDGPQSIAKNVQPSPQTLPEAGLVRSLSNKQKGELQRSGTVEKTKPVLPISTKQLGRGFEYQSQLESQSGGEVSAIPREIEKSTAPQRGPSFRERAAAPLIAAVTGAAGGAAVGRSGSKKLRKEPPGDPWFNKRMEAEQRFKEVVPMRQSLENRRESNVAAGGPLGSAPVNQQARYMAPETQAELSRQSTPPENANYDSEEDVYLARPVRRNPMSKVEQLTGQSINHEAVRRSSPQEQQLYADQLDRSDELGPEETLLQHEAATRTQIKTVNGIEYAAAPQVTSGDFGQKNAALGSDGHHHFSHIIHPGHLHRDHFRPGDGLYNPTPRLSDWKKAGVARLTGTLLDLEVKQTEAEKDKAWWEAGHTGKRRSSTSKRGQVDSYDGNYENSNAPTQFNPPLYLKSGPLLRYCGLRQEPVASRPGHSNSQQSLEIWRGSVMIVTTDAESVYDSVPTLRLFSQPMDLLPPPPAQVDGGADELAPEYVDPIAGLPKIGRDGKTLYVRPVEQLEEEKDLSKDESDNGLFEQQRSNLDTASNAKLDGAIEAKDQVPGRHHKSGLDGQKLGKYVDVKGVRLHAEQGVTFWRFGIEVELRPQQQRIAYRINEGPPTGFWVPARGQSMNIMFHSCNGFSLSVNPDQFSGPDPMWRDVLNTHQTQPFHVMLGGGDQIYNDVVTQSTNFFSEWLTIRNPLHKHNAPFTKEMQAELEKFYLDRYSLWFSQGLFGLANSQIPMVNIFDDHDIIDGFGSYPHHFMDSPVFCGLGAIAFKYYLLFQHQSIIDEGEETETSWILGIQPGPYIKELSRTVFMFLGSSVAFLGLDCRTERSREDVVNDDTYAKIFDRMHEEIVQGVTKHLIVLLGIPIAYPRLVWLENILTSRLMVPVKAVGKSGVFGKLLNQFDGGVEVLDDLDDHWTAKNHKEERNWFIEELQDLAAQKSVRITILGGDVHLGAIGQFYSNKKLGIPKDKDHRYMPNVISSAIVNTPPPEMMADILNKRNKVHHLNHETDEDMIPIFTHDVTGAKRNNTRLLPRRNWCSIREYNPELTPPPTPADERSPSPPREGLLRRFSTRRGSSNRPDAGPPPSRGLMRTISLQRGRNSMEPERPAMRERSSSWSTNFQAGNIFRRISRRRRYDDNINRYGSETDEGELPYRHPSPPSTPRMRGGAGNDSYFPRGITANATVPFSRTRVGRNADVQDVNQMYYPPQAGTRDDLGYTSYQDAPDDEYANPQVRERQGAREQISEPDVTRRPFHRTPTGMSEKQRRKAGPEHEINLEGGLDICLNMEVSQKDPAGITVPYRLLVPALWYEKREEDLNHSNTKRASGLLRLMSFRKGKIGRNRSVSFSGEEDEKGYRQKENFEIENGEGNGNGISIGRRNLRL